MVCYILFFFFSDEMFKLWLFFSMLFLIATDIIILWKCVLLLRLQVKIIFFKYCKNAQKNIVMWIMSMLLKNCKVRNPIYKKMWPSTSKKSWPNRIIQKVFVIVNNSLLYTGFSGGWRYSDSSPGVRLFRSIDISLRNFSIFHCLWCLCTILIIIVVNNKWLFRFRLKKQKHIQCKFRNR